MWAILVLAISAVVSAAEFETEDNGWIPVSSDVVYQQMRHGFVQPPRYSKAYNVQTLQADAEMLSVLSRKYQSKEYKDGNTTPNRNKQKTQDFASFYDENNEANPKPESENKFMIKKKYQPMKNKTDNIVRKSKNLILDESLPEPNENVNVIEEKFAEDYLHTYKVVEDEIDQKEPVEKSGYDYNRPDPKNSRNDLTKYLFKYNIKENDNLQNYEISRRLKLVNLPRRVEYKPLHFEVPFRYNNLNYMPVDPLLAVYLSNYGYYLQGQYGIQNNYNNLYGYLASNNIHNNRPFGHYKLFSDTDSSL